MSTKSTITIPVQLAAPAPLSPWFRFGIIDSFLPGQKETMTQVRVLKDFCLHLQIEGSSWVWCEDLNGSIDIHPGDLLFFPPGFIHAWAYTGETHLAIHFDLQHDKSITPRNYEQSFGMIDFIDETGHYNPVSVMPVFNLFFPGQSENDGWHIPMVTRLKDTAVWQERLSSLVYLWQTESLDSLAAEISVCHTIIRAIDSLASQSTYSNKNVDDPRVVSFLQRLQNPAELAAAAICNIEELAKQIGMKTTTFYQTFKAVTGRSPHQYIRERQIQQAATLLKKSSLPIRVIAESVGFSDSFHFCRVFHKITGSSPSHFRRQP